MIEREHIAVERQDLREVVLASGSPRRLELLRVLGLRPSALPVDIDEARCADEPVLDYVARMAVEKARRGVERAAGRLPVLGGDTVVCLGGRSFGKPRDDRDAKRMLMTLSGLTHNVHSAVCLIAGGRERVVVVSSRVTFAALDGSMIDNYIATGESQDKAGAYAIQGLGASFISDLRGSYSAVMGLPLFETANMLREAGVDVLLLAAGTESNE